MKSFLFGFAFFLSSFSAHAQTSSIPLDQLYPGYQPTVFNSYQEVEKLFNEMPLGFRDKSQCYQRAELWSYNLYRNQHVNPMKIFIFYTHTYRRAYDFEWWFHVAPYTLVKNPATQQLEEVILDPTFADTPLAPKPWSDLFRESTKACAEFVPYEIFRNEVENGSNAKFGTEHCYLVRVPGTDYDPTDVAARGAGMKNGYHYGSEELEQAVSNAPLRGNRGYWRSLLGL